MSETIEQEEGASAGIGAGLAWGVKASFLRYLTSAPGGSVTTSGEALTTRDGTFYFAVADQSGFDAQSLSGTIKFSGRVNFVGHFGALNVSIVDPWVTLDGEGGVLSAEWGTGPDSRTDVAHVHPDAPVAVGPVLMWREAATTLARAAVPYFNGVYSAGEAFDPLSMRVLRN